MFKKEENYTAQIDRMELVAGKEHTECIILLHSSNEIYIIKGKGDVNPLLALSEKDDEVEFSSKEVKAIFSNKVIHKMSTFRNITLEKRIDQTIKTYI